MPEYGLTSELEQLFNAALDETLTADQQAALEAALADPQLLDTYLAFCRFHADLRYHAQSARSIETALREVAPGVCPTAPDQRPLAAGRAERFERLGRWTDRVARQIHPRQHPVYFGAAVLLLSFGLWALFVAFLNPSFQPRPVAHDTATEPTGIARVHWVHRVRWEGFVPSGRGMPAGQQLVLSSGLAELRYYTGATVILEGPAEFWVGGQEAGDSNSNPQSAIRNPQSNSGFLQHGKLVARCGTRDSKGFTVDTPRARVRDLGTEFAVDVHRDGAAAVEVLSGEVEMVVQSAGGGGQRMRLKKGQGASVDSDGKTVIRRGEGNVPLPDSMRDRLQKLRPELAAAAEQGEMNFVAFHDLGGERSPGNITTQSDLAKTVDLVKFADGSDTGIDFSVTGGKLDTRTVEQGGGPVTRPPSAGTPAGELFLASRIDLDDGMVDKQGGTMTFTFTGLDPNLLYDVALYGDRDEKPDGVERFTLNGANAATNRSSTGIVRTGVTDMETRPNAPAGHVVRWTDVAPGADGTITIDISTSGTNIAYLSAVRLAARAAQPKDQNTESK